MISQLINPFSHLHSPKIHSTPEINMSKMVPIDLLTDIFRQLPVETLLRFRCLSLPLCSLIDNPLFIHLHLSHSIATKSNHSIILKDWNLYTLDFDSLNSVASTLDLPFYPSAGTEVVGSFHGLVALRNWERNVSLYNISSRKLKRVTPSDIDAPRYSRTGYVFYGFGFDSTVNDFKLVRMAPFFGGCNDDDAENIPSSYVGMEVKVFSLNTNSWRKVLTLPHYLRYLHKPLYQVLHKRGYGVLAGNALHWASPQWPELGLNNFILAFDLGAEEFRLVPQPEYDGRDRRFQVDVGVLEGCLCAMSNYMCVYVDLWVMKEYGVKESWTKLLSLHETNCIKTSIVFLRPLIYSKDGVRVLLEVNDQKLVWFDLIKKRARFVKIRAGPKSFGAEVYVESLVPLDDDIRNEQIRKQELEEMERKIADGKKRDDFLSVGFKLKL